MWITTKISYGALMLLLAHNCAMADDIAKASDYSGIFVVVDAGALAQKTKTSIDTANMTSKQKDSFSDSDLVGDFGLKVGYYFNPHRLYGSYSYNIYSRISDLSVLPMGNIENTLLNYINASYNAHKFTIGYDYLP